MNPSHNQMVHPTAGTRHENVSKDDPNEERSECYKTIARFCSNIVGDCATWICTCCPSPYKTVPESHFGIVREFGRYTKTLRPGLHYIRPMVETLTLVDTRMSREKVIVLQQQSIMTKDNVNVTIDGLVYYKGIEIESVELAITEISKTALKDLFRHTLLQEALETKEKMANLIRDTIQRSTYNWGVNINKVLIQEILF